MDWTHPDLISALAADSVNGFCGFQCDSPQIQDRTPCMYLGQPFLAYADHRNGFPSYEINENVFIENLHEALKDTVPKGNVWITDYLGRNFLTINTCEYLHIPDIINAVLRIGYKFLTHGTPGSWNAEFMPGDVFTRISFEEKLLESIRMNFDMLYECNKKRSAEEVWDSLNRMAGFRVFLKHWNYATQEGRDFCTHLRRMLRKKRLVSEFQDRMTWPKYCEIAHRYGILHCGGWSQYEPQNIIQAELPEKRPKIEQEEEQECMICLSAPPTTLVLPCEHRVVCDSCSQELCNTPDAKICVQCRCPITHVAYTQGNRLEEK